MKVYPILGHGQMQLRQKATSHASITTPAFSSGRLKQRSHTTLGFLLTLVALCASVISLKREYHNHVSIAEAHRSIDNARNYDALPQGEQLAVNAMNVTRTVAEHAKGGILFDSTGHEVADTINRLFRSEAFRSDTADFFKRYTNQKGRWVGPSDPKQVYRLFMEDVVQHHVVPGQIPQKDFKAWMTTADRVFYQATAFSARRSLPLDAFIPGLLLTGVSLLLMMNTENGKVLKKSTVKGLCRFKYRLQKGV